MTPLSLKRPLSRVMTGCALALLPFALSPLTPHVPLSSSVVFAQALPPAEVKQAMKATWDNDAARAARYRGELTRLMSYFKEHKELTTPGADGLLTRAQREGLWRQWSSALDYLYGLEAIRTQHRRYYKSDVSKKLSRKAFLLSYGALVMSYGFAIEMARWSQSMPEAVRVALNEPVEELSLREKSLDELLSAYLNPKMIMEITVKDLKYRFFTRKKGASEHLPKALYQAVTSDRERALELKDHGASELTWRHALDQLKKDSLEAVFPIQANISEWMGDTKIKHPPSRVSHEQIEALKGRLVIGDVLLERREWYLSNIGLPGYWPHAAVYVGVPAQWAELDQDEAVSAWVREQGEVTGRFEALIKGHFPKAFARHMSLEAGHERRVIEAISEGVSHTSLEHSADCDSLLVLRPRVTNLSRAKAIYKSFYYSGRPYDFDFNFLTDQTLVCTEVVQKVYEPSDLKGEGKRAGDGLALSTVSVMGRDVIPANHIAKLFDESYARAEGSDEARPFDFVLFYDGDAKGPHAVEGDLASARKSWRRPKWRWR